MADAAVHGDRHRGWVAPLCWSAVALEGFDLVVLGVVLPSLLREPAWGLTPGTASLISVVGLLGVMVGALSAGPLADLIGRRRAMLLTVVSFSVLTLLCAFATGPVVFGLLRFLAGLGLGGVLPVALAMVNEFGRAGRGGSATTTLMTGYHAGAVLTALLGIWVIPSLTWRAMFVIGALPALVLVPLVAARLPESLPGADRVTPAATTRATRHNPVAELVRGGYLRSSIAFWAASFMGLLLVYGLNTWLPEIMLRAGFNAKGSLSFLAVLNGGSLFGALAASRAADRFGPKPVVAACFATGALALVLLTLGFPLAGLLAIIAVVGLGTSGTQTLIYGFVANYYRTNVRAAGVAWCAGFGRLGGIGGPMLGSTMIGAGFALDSIFYVLA
ncbi:MAG: MFS transporter, partial [Pseudonocardia sediminis]